MGRRGSDPAGSGWRYLDANCVNGLGDELSRLVATRYDITVTPFSEYAYDCRGNLSAATNELGDVVLTASDPDGNVIAAAGEGQALTIQLNDTAAAVC